MKTLKLKKIPLIDPIDVIDKKGQQSILGGRRLWWCETFCGLYSESGSTIVQTISGQNCYECPGEWVTQGCYCWEDEGY